MNKLGLKDSLGFILIIIYLIVLLSKSHSIWVVLIIGLIIFYFIVFYGIYYYTSHKYMVEYGIQNAKETTREHERNLEKLFLKASLWPLYYIKK